MNKNLSDNFKEGYEAFSRVVMRRGKYHHVVANPMKKNTTSHKEWQRGWEAAYFKNLEKLNGLGKRS